MTNARQAGVAHQAVGSPETGQSLVELSLILPLFLLMLTAMLEFGLAFNHHLTLEYATREGARTGAALVNGGGAYGCNSGQSPGRGDVDPAIISAVQRVLTSPGSPVKIAKVDQIRIYRSTSSGGESSGDINVWTPGNGVVVDGVQLDFVQGSVGWNACERRHDVPPESIGVTLDYRYDLETPMAALLRLMGGQQAATFRIDDRTVFALNPVSF